MKGSVCQSRTGSYLAWRCTLLHSVETLAKTQNTETLWIQTSLASPFLAYLFRTFHILWKCEGDQSDNFEVISIFVTSLHAGFGRKASLNVRKFVKNRVWERIANNKPQNTSNNRFYFSVISIFKTLDSDRLLNISKTVPSRSSYKIHNFDRWKTDVRELVVDYSHPKFQKTSPFSDTL